MKYISDKWWAIIATSLILFLLNVDATAVNLALVQIATEFHANLSSIQWVINSYLLAASSLMIVGGRLGDIFGRRRMFLLGTIFFTLASILAGISFSFPLLIFSRILQGLAMAIVLPQLIAIVALSFPLEQKGLALSINASVAGFSQAIGPTFGGFLLHFFGWRWIFFINIPVGILAMMCTFWKMPRSLDATHREKIDYVGATFLSLALFIFIFSFNEVQHWGLLSKLFLSMLVTTGILIAAFIIVERKIAQPLVPLSLFKTRNYVLALLIRLPLVYGFGMLLFLMSLYFQNILGYSVLFSGFVFLFLTLFFGGISPFAGKWIDRIGERKPLIISMGLLAIAFYILAYAGLTTSFLFFIIPFLLIGISWGISVTGTVTTALKAVPHNQISVASGILYTIIYVEWTLGVAITGLILVTIGEHVFMNLLQQAQLQLTSSQLAIAKEVYSGVHSGKVLLEQFPNPAQGQIVLSLAHQAFIHAYKIAMLVTAALHLFGLALSFFITTDSRKHVEVVEPLA